MNMMDHVQLIKSYIHSQNMKWLRMESATDRCAGGVAEGAGRRDVPEDGARGRAVPGRRGGRCRARAASRLSSQIVWPATIMVQALAGASPKPSRLYALPRRAPQGRGPVGGGGPARGRVPVLPAAPPHAPGAQRAREGPRAVGPRMLRAGAGRACPGECLCARSALSAARASTTPSPCHLCTLRLTCATCLSSAAACP